MYVKIAFIQCIASALVICLTGFQMLTVPFGSVQFYRLIIYFCSMFEQVALYCWFGHNIMLKSEEICDACYMSDWYNSDARIKKYLFIIMERSKRSFHVVTYLGHISESLMGITNVKVCLCVTFLETFDFMVDDNDTGLLFRLIKQYETRKRCKQNTQQSYISGHIEVGFVEVLKCPKCRSNLEINKDKRGSSKAPYLKIWFKDDDPRSLLV
ncbi:hypothetical protein NQ317_007091 [Molorchus minor]|uniref:Uncharacterized protein n=1 Tax=Molorchus minor TaxID=1323400 RepID=A0ABQ9K581_9CUCU|nr:hypothetical protein NQ317_007091 [Molorchus minor]